MEAAKDRGEILRRRKSGGESGFCHVLPRCKQGGCPIDSDPVKEPGRAITRETLDQLGESRPLQAARGRHGFERPRLITHYGQTLNKSTDYRLGTFGKRARIVATQPLGQLAQGGNGKATGEEIFGSGKDRTGEFWEEPLHARAGGQGVSPPPGEPVVQPSGIGCIQAKQRRPLHQGRFFLISFCRANHDINKLRIGFNRVGSPVALPGEGEETFPRPNHFHPTFDFPFDASLLHEHDFYPRIAMAGQPTGGLGRMPKSTMREAGHVQILPPHGSERQSEFPG